MKSTGIVRQVDELERIVIPMEHRRSYEVSDNDSGGKAGLTLNHLFILIISLCISKTPILSKKERGLQQIIDSSFIFLQKIG